MTTLAPDTADETLARVFDAAPGALAALAEAAMAQVLAQVLAERSGAVMTSLCLDSAAPPPAGTRLSARAWTERTTRSLVFVGAEITDGSALVAVASAIFRIPPPLEGA